MDVPVKVVRGMRVYSHGQTHAVVLACGPKGTAIIPPPVESHPSLAPVWDWGPAAGEGACTLGFFLGFLATQDVTEAWLLMPDLAEYVKGFPLGDWTLKAEDLAARIKAIHADLMAQVRYESANDSRQRLVDEVDAIWEREGIWYDAGLAWLHGKAEELRRDARLTDGQLATILTDLAEWYGGVPDQAPDQAPPFGESDYSDDSRLA